MDDQSRNLILATALSFLVILAWFFLFSAGGAGAGRPTQPGSEASQGTTTPPVAGTEATAPQLTAPAPKTREAALALTTRVPIKTARLVGLAVAGRRADRRSRAEQLYASRSIPARRS